MKLLIVDDHAGMRAMIRESVGDLFSCVLECSSGAEAVAECGEFAPDCVTVDLGMRPMNGFQTLELLRALRPWAHFVVVTQFDDGALRERSRFAGASRYIVKDRLQELRAHLQSLQTPPAGGPK